MDNSGGLLLATETDRQTGDDDDAKRPSFSSSATAAAASFMHSFIHDHDHPSMMDSMMMIHKSLSEPVTRSTM